MATFGIAQPQAGMIDTPALEALRLRKEFGGREVVRGVSLRVNHGEVVGLVGPNGAGKTTTIRMMLGILTPNEGEARAFGGPLTEKTQDRIGYLPEERGLYEGLKLTVVLEYLGQLKGLARPQAALRAREMLETVGLSEHANKKVRELSRGMTQLVQFAATLLHRPDILVLDEPFSGLDPGQRPPHERACGGGKATRRGRHLLDASDG